MLWDFCAVVNGQFQPESPTRAGVAVVEQSRVPGACRCCACWSRP